MNTINLNGEFFYIADAEEKLSIDDVKNIYENDDRIPKAVLPMQWELHGLQNHNGAVWYIKELEKFNALDDLKILEFCGVDYFSSVWINWEQAGTHEGYFQKFCFDVSRFIQLDKKNILVVKVTSPFEEPGKVWPYKKRLIKGVFNHHDCRPGGWSELYGQDKNTGGIWNDINLYSRINHFIKDIKITPVLDRQNNSADVKIELSCLANSAPTSLIAQIVNPQGKTLFERNITIEKEESEILFSFMINSPSLWWPWDLGSPNLYRLKIEGGEISSGEIEFGIRDVKLDDDNRFFINGKRLFLRGTNIIPEQFLSNFTIDKIDSLVSMLKEANINIVRVHAHINREELYNALNKAGIMVWQDFSLQWTYDDSAEFKNNAVSQIKDMALQLYNHPSIVIWCCHNEPGDQIKTLDPELYAAVRSIDQTRIIRIASNYEEHPYDGWYWGNKEHFAAVPMGPLVTEFGAQAVPSIESLSKFLTNEEIEKPEWSKWEYHNFQYEQTFNVAQIDKGKSVNEFIENSQQYQSELIKTAVDFYRRKRFDGITGVFQFMFIDSWPSITWSVVDYYNQKKKGFYQLKDSFQPVYVSVRMRQTKYLPGKDLQLDIWIINDLHESYEDLALRIILDDQTIGAIDNINLSGDSVKFYNYESLKFIIPINITCGNYVLGFELMNNGKVLSGNKYKMEIVNKINSWS